MRKLAVIALLMSAAFGAGLAPASAQQEPPWGGPFSAPFSATLSNITPLAFGMNAAEVSQALGTPLYYLQGRPGDEILLAYRNVRGSGIFFHKDRLYLQFRQGRLTGWKGDWGHSWMW